MLRNLIKLIHKQSVSVSTEDERCFLTNCSFECVIESSCKSLVLCTLEKKVAFPVLDLRVLTNVLRSV